MDILAKMMEHSGADFLPQLNVKIFAARMNKKVKIGRLCSLVLEKEMHIHELAKLVKKKFWS